MDNRHKGHIGVCTHGYGAHQVRSQFGAEENGRRAVSAADNAYGASLVGSEAESKSQEVCAEYTHLCGGADQHQAGLGDKRRKIGHRPYAQKNERGIPPLPDALVEGIQYRTVFINSDVHSREHGNVADNDAKAYRHQQHGLPFLDYAKGYEDCTDCNHCQMLPGAVCKAGKLPELNQAVEYLLHYDNLMISAPSSTESPFCTRIALTVPSASA